VLDQHATFHKRVNPAMVWLQALDTTDEERIAHLVRRHVAFTGSAHAASILTRWVQLRRAFVKIMPKDLQAVLDAPPASAAAPIEAKSAQARELAHG
jgi:glutamate synthase (NADPH/NADH) large chain